MDLGGGILISILDNSLKRVAIIKDIIEPWRFEEINGENTLEFKAVLTEKVANFVDEDHVVEYDDDFFDIAYYSKDLNEDGTATMAAECEHISYRLNNPEYYLDYFTFIGTPTQILNEILNDTGFTVGTVEFSDEMTYSVQERMSRRAILMEFVALLGGEVEFNKFSISILNRRGSSDLQIFTKGKNIKIISKVYDGRENPPRIAYICNPIVLPNKNIYLGDDILLIQPELNIQDSLRVVSIGYNPLEPMEKEIEIANYINGLEDQLYRIGTTTVAKEKVYNGCRIGPEEGFVVERTDEKAKTVMNATEGISIFSDVGEGLQRNFFVDLNGRIQARELDISGDATFKGTITASSVIGGTISGTTITGGSINIGSGNFVVNSNGDMIAYSGYFEGTIEASDIYGSYISGSTISGGTISGTTINTLQNATVGNNLYIGSMSNNFSKGIYFSSGTFECEISLNSSGMMSIFNWTDIDIYSTENIDITSVEDIEIIGDTVDISCWSGGAVILDYEAYVGYKDAIGDNLVATLGDIENAILAHIAEYH